MKNWFVAPRLPSGPFLCYISHLLGWPFGGATLVIWSSVTNMATTLYSELWVLNTNVLLFLLVIFWMWHISEPPPQPPISPQDSKVACREVTCQCQRNSTVLSRPASLALNENEIFAGDVIKNVKSPFVISIAPLKPIWIPDVLNARLGRVWWSISSWN